MNDLNRNIEIEFKSKIDKDTYLKLLHHFNLENNVFKHINYYFDTDNLDLNKKEIVLRIRQKGEDSFKLTLKSQSEYEAYEYHVFLEKNDALNIIENGFNTKKYFDAFDYDVKFIILLDNYRAKTPFDGGTLFIDYSEYCGNTDYEIEYEVNHYEKGMIAWDELLSNFKIEIKPLKRKSERALTCLI